MKPSPGISLGRPVKRMLQGTNRICGNRSHSGGTSHFGHSPSPSITAVHIDEAAALPSPAVMLSARLKQYYGRLRRPSGTPPTSRNTGYRARSSSHTIRRSPGRGGPLQFPSPPSIRSELHTSGSPSRLHFQDLHRFHGLHPDGGGSALPDPHPKAGILTTPQASLHATDRIFASP